MSDQRHWLMKSEPDVYGLDDLERDGTTYWDGVRNYQARNYMRDDMRLGDLVLYYHSNCKPPGIVGVARVTRESYPDPTQFDPESKYYDAKSSPDEPRWQLVDIGFHARFPRLVSLQEMKDDEELDGMLVIRRGQRLSIQPVEARHFEHVCSLGGLDFDT